MQSYVRIWLTLLSSDSMAFPNASRGPKHLRGSVTGAIVDGPPPWLRKREKHPRNAFLMRRDLEVCEHLWGSDSAGKPGVWAESEEEEEAEEGEEVPSSLPTNVSHGGQAPYGSVLAGDRSTPQLTVMSVNLGNLSRKGASSDGTRCEPLLWSFLAGSYHVCLVQEAWNLPFGEQMLLKSGYSSYSGHDGSLACIVSDPNANVMVLEDLALTSPLEYVGKKCRNSPLHLHLVRISWGGDADGGIVTKSGLQSVCICNCRFHHVVAKSTDHRHALLQELVILVTRHRVHIICGDFNQGGSEAIRLLQSIPGTVSHVRRAPDHPGDPGCCVIVIVAWETSFPYDVSVSKEMLQMQNHSLGLRPSDGDWHRPLYVTLRNTRKRQRSAAKQFARKQKRRAAKKQGNKMKQSTNDDNEGSFLSSPLPVGLQKTL